MEFSEIRPLISGLAGGLISIALVSLWARWVPKRSGEKSAAWLRDTYRGTIGIANALLSLGLLSAIALYPLTGFPDTDWRPLGLGIGGGCTAALFALALLPLLWRGSPRDAFIAFAIAQRTPAWLLYGLLIGGACSLPSAAFSLLG